MSSFVLFREHGGRASGLPIKAYQPVATALELTSDEEDRLFRISQRARARWKQRERLDPETPDRVVRLARVLTLALEVLESFEHASAWLREPSDALG